MDVTMPTNPDWFQNIEKKKLPKAPPFSKTLQIDKIASDSPAAHLKLRQGDKLLSVNGKAALLQDIPLLLASSSSVQYRFFLPRETALLEVTTKALPLGFLSAPSSDGIVEQYKLKGEFEAEGLLQLWERGDYAHIRQACAITSKRLNKMNVLGRLTGRKKTIPFTDMMLAICEIETGNPKTGYKALKDYAADHAYGATSNIRGVLKTYLARHAREHGQNDDYYELIGEAFSLFPQSERIRRESLKAGLDINVPDPRIGRRVETSRTWQCLEGGQGIKSLGDMLAQMAPGHYLPLCLMTAYRGNSPYNQALLPYIALSPWINPRLHSLVVLTNQSEKRKDRPHWNSHENLARQVGCPLTVLFGDFDEQIIEDFAPRGAPEFFVLDRDGQIVWTGDLATDYDYWEVLAGLRN